MSDYEKPKEVCRDGVKLGGGKPPLSFYDIYVPSKPCGGQAPKTNSPAK